MTSDSQNLRRYMNLMEGALEPTKVETLIEGWVDNLKNKFNHSLGQKERAQLAKRLTSEWYKWLGTSRREGNEKDLLDFMQKRIGFKNDDIAFVLNHADLQVPKEVEQGAEAEEEPQGKKIRRGNEPENLDEPDDADDQEETEVDPEEEGTPLPTDLDTKLSDYKDIKPGEKPKGSEPEQSHDDKYPVTDVIKKRRRAFQKPNGDLDYAAIGKFKKTMKPGQVLQLIGDDGKKAPESYKAKYPGEPDQHLTDPKHLSDEDGDEVQEESIMEAPEPAADADADEAPADAPAEAPKEQGKIAKATLEKIMDICAGRINDQYIYNGPKNDADHAAAQQAQSTATRNGIRSGKLLPSGQYDKNELENELKNLGVPVSHVPKLISYINGDMEYTDMPRSTQEALAKVGYAFLKARS